MAVPSVPKNLYPITTPSHASSGAIPGGYAYPNVLPAKLQTHMFRYLLGSQASFPPLLLNLTESSSRRKEPSFVAVLVIPSVGLPSGSLLASLNPILASAASSLNGRGIL